MHLRTRHADTDAPRGTVLLAHGYAEHSGRFLPLHDALVAAGYDIAFYDHYGHGESEGPRAAVDVGRLIADHRDMRRIAVAHARTDDLILFGHSMGGLITAASVILDPDGVRATVLTGPAVRPLPAIPAGAARALMPLARLAPRLIAKPTAPRRGSVLSRDPRVQEAFDADPLTWKGGVPLLTGATMILHGDEVLRRADRMRGPLLVVHGSDDALADLDGSRRLVAAAVAAHPDADIRLRIVDGAYHEVLNEPEGPELIGEILAWLADR
ncbi:lysophospholipase [Actinomyces sp. B33]|uniref:alpha/beta hydrolase n=1 Tax=Actinomyces sp. B33 TaxID=2942131 RepID=UPI0023402938|nr:alpha/beta hydrolase [Actinomyces sp. B33]MDC4233580.1 lysophospholipase [Actinomyces sp. B33]